MPRSQSTQRKAPATARERILEAGAQLVAEGGSAAITTRAVCEIADVQAPTLYRLFVDKQGLLDAVAEHVFAEYVARKARGIIGQDPVDELRNGWDAHVTFGLTHPAVFGLIHASTRRPSAAVEAGLAVLQARVHRVAASGRLRVSEERAVDLLHAAGTGTVFALLAKSPDARAGLSEAARDAVFRVILDVAAAPTKAGIGRLASALRASMDEVQNVTPGERALLNELLERIATPH